MGDLTAADIAAITIEIERRQRERRFDFFKPYTKQLEFLTDGRENFERLLRAGNQQGKSETGAYETALHMTGLYPPWWKGKVFKHAPRGWLCGETTTATRDIVQNKLCGRPGLPQDLGTGMIPKEYFTEKPTLAHGAAGAFDTIFVKHVSGQMSTATFKSYEQGRPKFQGEPLDFIWADEEAPEDIYLEILARTIATGGIAYTTFTPLKGVTELVRRFRTPATGRKETVLTVDDIEDPKHKELVMAKAGLWPKHQKQARLYGIPVLGGGAVFEDIAMENLKVPLYLSSDEVHHSNLGPIATGLWGKLWAIDFGIGHPFAAVLLGWDKDYDTVYVLAEIRMEGTVPAVHASRMKQIAAAVPVAWPHDGNDREKSSGEQLYKYYRDEGLKMMDHHATFADGGYSTEAGIMELLTRMRSDRFKVSASCTMWADEFSSYKRENGLIVKEYDDLMSATRIGIMQLRAAKQVGFGSKLPGVKRASGMCRDVELDDPWNP